MATLSDRDRFLPLVAHAAQTKRFSHELIRKAARRKVPLLAPKHTKGYQRRLALGPAASGMPFVLPHEFGADPFMGASEAPTDEAGDATAEARSRSGRATRRAAHTLFNWVMQSTWTGGINDITSVMPEAFGAESRYQAPLRSSLDLRRAAELLWQQFARSKEEAVRPRDDDADGDEGGGAGTEADLPASHVTIDDASTAEGLATFRKITPSAGAPSLSTDDDSDSTNCLFATAGVADSCSADYSGDAWRLPKTSASAEGNTNHEGFPNPARNLLTGIDNHGRGVWQNTSLFGCAIDSGNNGGGGARTNRGAEHQLCVPAKGDLSAFRHLDGSPHAFVVAACVAKVFDIILKSPGLRRRAIITRTAEDSHGLWTDWHVDCALSFLERGAFVEPLAHDGGASERWPDAGVLGYGGTEVLGAPPAPWAVGDVSTDNYVRGTFARGDEYGEASPFGCVEEALAGGARRDDGVGNELRAISNPFGGDAAYRATLHGITQAAAGGDFAVHPSQPLLQ